MRADVNAILVYFELEHQISIGTAAARGKGAPWNAPSRKATSDDKKIKVLVTENPKRGKSRDRFALYQNGQTVEQFVARIVKAGNPVSVARADLRWDMSKGLIAVQ